MRIWHLWEYHLFCCWWYIQHSFLSCSLQYVGESEVYYGYISYIRFCMATQKHKYDNRNYNRNNLIVKHIYELLKLYIYVKYSFTIIKIFIYLCNATTVKVMNNVRQTQCNRIFLIIKMSINFMSTQIPFINDSPPSRMIIFAHY